MIYRPNTCDICRQSGGDIYQSDEGHYARIHTTCYQRVRMDLSTVWKPVDVRATA